MNILPATVDDIPELLWLIQYSFRGDRGWCRDDHLMEGTRVTREMLEKDLSTPTGLLWKCVKAEEDKNGDGTKSERSRTIIATAYTKKLAETNMLYVGRLCVDPDFQTCGLGKKLMNKVEERAKSLNCRGITLQVIFARTDLIQWYERQGYKLTGEREALVDGEYGKFLVAPELLDLVTLEKLL